MVAVAGERCPAAARSGCWPGSRAATTTSSTCRRRPVARSPSTPWPCAPPWPGSQAWPSTRWSRTTTACTSGPPCAPTPSPPTPSTLLTTRLAGRLAAQGVARPRVEVELRDSLQDERDTVGVFKLVESPPAARPLLSAKERHWSRCRGLGRRAWRAVGRAVRGRERRRPGLADRAAPGPLAGVAEEQVGAAWPRRRRTAGAPRPSPPVTAGGRSAGGAGRSSQPTRNTTENSRPLAACRVSSDTPSARGSQA